jgi:hypothetical protein
VSHPDAITGTAIVSVVTYPDMDISVRTYSNVSEAVRRIRCAYPNVIYDANTLIVDVDPTQNPFKDSRRIQLWVCDINGGSYEVPSREWCDWVGIAERARAAEAVNAPLATAYLQQQLDAGTKLPLGMCFRCGMKQHTLREGGLWICGELKQWACTNCKYGHFGPEIRTKSFGTCEVCCSKNIKLGQCGTYECRDCEKASGVSVKE